MYTPITANHFGDRQRVCTDICTDFYDDVSRPANLRKQGDLALRKLAVFADGPTDIDIVPVEQHQSVLRSHHGIEAWIVNQKWKHSRAESGLCCRAYCASFSRPRKNRQYISEFDDWANDAVRPL
jgi:hypothetical protein